MIRALCSDSQIPGFWLSDLAKRTKLNQKLGI
jgi:hypothetical protein